jgi:hypothetical protein
MKIKISESTNEAAIGELNALITQINGHKISFPKPGKNDKVNTENTNDDLKWLERAVARALQLERMV